MIISRLRGGLGNQMFQYTLGKHLSIKNKTDLLLDTSFLDEKGIVSPRNFELGVFDIKSKIATNNDLKKYPKNKLYNKLNKLLGFRKNLVIEKTLNFDSSVLSLGDNVLLDGYWQSEKYFKDIRVVLEKEFLLKNCLSTETSSLLQKIKNENSVSIHIRRGDYVDDKKTNEHHGTCSLAYYEKAIELITKKISGLSFYVFSDDIEWAKDNLKIKTHTHFIDGKKNFEDFELMKNCKNNIIANSSFSWWAAWLNQNEDKIVIAPSKWLSNTKYSTKDIIPDSWNKI